MYGDESYYLGMAYAVATESPDLSTQNGGVLILADERSPTLYAYNKFPDGVKVTYDRLSVRPDKYDFTGHAEEWLVQKCARHGLVAEGSTLYCPWAACAPCARDIVNSGIRRVVRHLERCQITNNQWVSGVDRGDVILLEGGVELVDWSGSIDAPSIRSDYKLWSPKTLKYV